MVEADSFIEADLLTVLAFMKATFFRDDEVACVGGCRGLVLISAANEGMSIFQLDVDLEITQSPLLMVVI